MEEVLLSPLSLSASPAAPWPSPDPGKWRCAFGGGGRAEAGVRQVVPRGRDKEKPSHLPFLLSRAGSLVLEHFSSCGSFLAVVSPFWPRYLPPSPGVPKGQATTLAWQLHHPWSKATAWYPRSSEGLLLPSHSPNCSPPHLPPTPAES